jgi:hypothetical protein
LGVRLLDPDGRVVDELRGVAAPPGLAPGDEVTLFAELQLPAAPGDYHLMFDMVEEQICWFSERGSTPAIVSLRVAEQSGARLHPADLVPLALDIFRRSDLDVDLGQVERSLVEGGALEDVFVALRNASALPLRVELDLRGRLDRALPA